MINVDLNRKEKISFFTSVSFPKCGPPHKGFEKARQKCWSPYKGFENSHQKPIQLSSIAQFILEKCDSYFHLSGIKGVVTSTSSENRDMTVTLLNPTPQPVWIKVLKIVSYFTLLIPLIILVVKSFFRWKYNFIIFKLDPLFLGALEYLPPQDLANVCQVSRQWNFMGSKDLFWQQFNLKKIFPKLTVIDKNFWQQCFRINKKSLPMEDPPINKKTVLDLNKMSCLKVRNDAGFSLLTLYKGISIEKILDFIKNPKKGTSFEVDHFWKGYLSNFKENAIEESHRVIITNSILLEENTEMRPPSVLEAIVLSCLIRVNSSKQKKKSKSVSVVRSTKEEEKSKLVVTRCLESSSNDKTVLFSTFSPPYNPIKIGLQFNGEQGAAVALRL